MFHKNNIIVLYLVAIIIPLFTYISIFLNGLKNQFTRHTFSKIERVFFSRELLSSLSWIINERYSQRPDFEYVHDSLYSWLNVKLYDYCAFEWLMMLTNVARCFSFVGQLTVRRHICNHYLEKLLLNILSKLFLLGIKLTRFNCAIESAQETCFF